MLLASEVTSSVGGVGFDTLFVVVFALVGLLVVAGFVFVGYSMVRSARAAKRHGIDPFTSEAQLIAQAIDGPRPTLEQRLAELDDLHRRGIISSDEHRDGRARAISSG